jgi:hypothetical protein
VSVSSGSRKFTVLVPSLRERPLQGVTALIRVIRRRS